MGDPIKKLTIKGFKSIRELNLELRALNIMIGANGAGKSNFVGFFRLLREMIDQKLARTVRTEGGADACLHMGPKFTKEIIGKLYFGDNGYEFAITPTADNTFVFSDESTFYRGVRRSLGSGHTESRLKDHRDTPGVTAKRGVPYYVFESVTGWVVYHFHDTSATAGVRRQGSINDNEFLRADADNLAAYLYRLQSTNPTVYQKIRNFVRIATPFFDDFKLRPVPGTPELIQLEWTQKDSDYLFRPSQLSDGTLRFICLATALLQPSLPATVLFDEPELGLHPYALTLLANLFQQAARSYGSHVSKQVIVSTQSALLLNEFLPEDVIVVERSLGQSTFRRLESANLSEWLKDYALGDLWQKNVLGGRPQNEDAPELARVAGNADREPENS